MDSDDDEKTKTAVEKMAAELRNAHRIREVLFASVAHDLRNPLNTFAMSAGLLRDDLEDESEPGKEFDRKRALSLLSRMDRASARMQATIEDLLEASRIEGDTLQLTLKEVDAKAIVASTIEKARPFVLEKGASIEEEDEPHTPEGITFTSDKARLIEALTKLVHVAIKTTGERGMIRVGATTSTNADEVHFTVRAAAKSSTAAAPPASTTTIEEHRGGLAFLIARGLTTKLGGHLDTEGLRTVVIFKKK
jgi:signal transduction histidine kinase